MDCWDSQWILLDFYGSLEMDSTTIGELYIWPWFSVISTNWIIKETIPCLMIWNVDYFHRSAVSVACILLYEQEKFHKNNFLFRADNATSTTWRLCRRNIASAGTTGHFNLKKATSYCDLVPPVGVTQLPQQQSPGPNPLLLRPDWDISYCAFSGRVGGHCQLEAPLAHSGRAIFNRTVRWNPYCSWPSEAVWSGEQVHVRYVITQEVEVDAANWNLCGHTVNVLFSFNLYPCWITHQLTKINATLPYILF